MRRFFLITLVITLLSSCAPVLKEEIMKTASFDLPFSDIRNNPDPYKGELFILGGLIVQTKLTEGGSLIEAVYVPVDSKGYLKDVGLSNERFLAFLPKEEGLLDPLIYRKEREITLAGELIETRTGKIDEMVYTYPVFEIKEIYLWRERRVYYPYYPSWYYPYWWDEPWPWWRPWWRPWYRHYPPYWW